MAVTLLCVINNAQTGAANHPTCQRDLTSTHQPDHKDTQTHTRMHKHLGLQRHLHAHTHTIGCVLSPVTLSCCHYACAHWEQVSLTSKDEGGTPPPCTASTHRHTNIQGPLLTYKSTHTLFCGLMPHFLLH